MYRVFYTAAIFVSMSLAPAWAQSLNAPQGDVILTVNGSIDTTNVDETAQFDLEMLQALESTTIETATIWTEGTKTFQGVTLADLVALLGVKGTTLRATAINDYAVEIPVSDAVQDGPIVAYLLDGDTMSVRDKGPLWIIYPFDSNSSYRTEVIYSRSIWQLDRIEAVE
ncbi:MAG: oxidoreductase [Marivita sp.]